MSKSIGELLKYTIRDPNTKEIFIMFYRKPFTRETLRYWREIWDPEKKSYREDDLLDESRIGWGERIIQTLEFNGTRTKSISSDPNSPAYDENWKIWLREKAPQILETLALKAFEGIDIGEKEKETEDPFPEKK